MKTKALKTLSLAGVAAAALLAPGIAAAQTAPAATTPPSTKPAPDDTQQAPDIIVTGVNSRLPPSLEAFPGSVTVIDQKEVNTQIAVSPDVGALLAQKVPGLSPQSFSASDSGQTLRGRGLAYYVDGVPISNPLRDGGRSMRTVATSAIAGVEVIRGASALYGNGGNGGAVNYITKRPDGEDGISGQSQVSLGGSLTAFKDSLDPFFQQELQVKKGGFDLLATGSAEFTSGFFDANGKRIASDPTGNGGINDSGIFTGYGKIGYTAGDHRLEASYMFYRQQQDTAWGRQILGNELLGIPTQAAFGQVDPRVVPQFTRNQIAQISYIYSGFFGGTARLQGYTEKNEQLFGFNATRAGGTQSRIQSKKDGARLDFNNPLSALGLGSGTLLWGAEYIRDRSIQVVNTKPERVFVPQLDQKDYAGFAQLELKVFKLLTIQAGVRHDKFTVDVDPFAVLTTGLQVQGGRLKYDSTVFNAGASLKLARQLTLYAGYSEGFSVADIGVAIRATKVVNPLVALRPQPVVVQNYEAGARGDLGFVRYTIAGFISKSKLGQSYAPDPTNPLLTIVVRAPEKLWGIEGTLDGGAPDALTYGGTFSWVRGNLDTNGDGVPDTPLPNDRVGPMKITGYLGYQIAQDFPVRLQGVYSGSRDAFPVAQQITTGNFGHIHPYVTFDMLVSHPVGGGTLALAITNILNKQYFAVSSQFSGNFPSRYVPAPGAGFRLSYTFKY